MNNSISTNKPPITHDYNNTTAQLQDSLYKYEWNDSTQELNIIWSSLHTQVITCISSWSKGIEVTTHEDNMVTLKPVTDEWRLPILVDIELPPAALSLWLEKIPKAILAACKLFLKHELNVLEIVSKNHAAAELLVSNTVLFGLWYFYCRTRSIGESGFVKGCHSKRRYLLCYFEYPDTKAIVKILQKLKLSEINTRTLSIVDHFFKRIVISIPISALSQQRIITLDYLKSVSLSPWFYASTIFGKQDFSSAEKLQLKRMLEDINEHGTTDLLNTASRCKSFKQLENFYERHFLEHAVPAHYPVFLQDKNGKPKAFPLPPILGTHLIKPINNYDTLWRLGRRMKHCASDMAIKIVNGHYYVYHMHRHYPATIGISISGDNFLAIDQIRGYANSEVPEYIQAYIKDWFQLASTHHNERAVTSPQTIYEYLEAPL